LSGCEETYSDAMLDTLLTRHFLCLLCFL